MQDISNYKKIKENAENFYKKIGRINCPAFNSETVYFNSEGFNHLIYKKKSERSKNDQITKFKLLSIAKEIIFISTTFQEYDEGLAEITRKRFKKRVKETVAVRYWGLVAIVRNRKVKVIIRQIGNGQKHFFSVIPAWTINHYNNTKIISTAKGNLSFD